MSLFLQMYAAGCRSFASAFLRRDITRQKSKRLPKGKDCTVPCPFGLFAADCVATCLHDHRDDGPSRQTLATIIMTFDHYTITTSC